MTFVASAPVRQTAAEKPDVPEMPRQREGDLVISLRLLWDHRRFLFRVGVYALLTSAAIALLIPSRYQSTTRLMPPENQSTSSIATTVAAMSGAVSGLGTMASDLLGLKSTSDIFVGILSSRTVQDKLVQQFDLKATYGDGRMEDARKDLAEHTGISIDRKSQIITISVTDHDPKRAAAMGEAYVEELNRLVAELSTSSARRERMFLEERLQAVTKDLELAEKEFSEFSSKNTTLDIKEQGKAMVEAAATLQGQLIAAESEYEGLRQIYTDNNVRVRSVRARVDELKHQLEKLGGKGETATSLSGPADDSLYPSIRKLPLLGVAYADLYRRTRVQEVVFEALTREYELAKVQEVKEIPVVKVLDAPNIPDKKSFPPRTLITFLGTSLAWVIAAAWIFARASWEQTDSADPRKAFAEEVFATLKARLPRFSANGSGSHHSEEESLKWVPRQEDKDKAPK